MSRREQKKSKKTLLALLILLIAIAIIIGTSLAFFSSTGLVSFAGKAGTLTISVNGGDEALTGAQQYFTKGGVADVQDFTANNMNPGDYIYIPITVENTGSKSAWVKAVLGDITVTAKDGTTDLSDGGMFTLLAIPSSIPAGTEDAYIKAQIETATPAFDDVANLDTVLSGSAEDDNPNHDTSATLRYIVYFDKEAGNEYQGATVNFDVNVQALQYRNTGDTDWTTVFTVNP